MRANTACAAGLVVLAAGKQKKVLSQINLGAPLYATPVAANGVLYVASLRYLYALSLKGTGKPMTSNH